MAVLDARSVLPLLVVLTAGCGLFGGDEVAVGSCLDRGEAGDDGRTAVELVACDRPHDLEVVGLLAADELGDDFPGEDELSRWSLQRCVEAFEEHIGTPYGRSPLELDVAAPTAEQWEEGRRDVRCSAMTGDGSQLTGEVGA